MACIGTVRGRRSFGRAEGMDEGFFKPYGYGYAHGYAHAHTRCAVGLDGTGSSLEWTSPLTVIPEDRALSECELNAEMITPVLVRKRGQSSAVADRRLEEEDEDCVNQRHSCDCEQNSQKCTDKCHFVNFHLDCYPRELTPNTLRFMAKRSLPTDVPASEVLRSVPSFGFDSETDMSDVENVINENCDQQNNIVRPRTASQKPSWWSSRRS